MGKLKYKPNAAFVQQINSMQSSWHATLYPKFEGKTLGELFRMRGGFHGKYGRYYSSLSVIDFPANHTAGSIVYESSTSCGACHMICHEHCVALWIRLSVLCLM